MYKRQGDYWLEVTETSQKKIQISSTKSGRTLLSSLLPESCQVFGVSATLETVSYTHLRAHETVLDLVCRLLLEKKKN
ncbi:hypothetical protein PVA38_11600 [Streptococcus pneumoniae D39]|nr:hypothetical protein PVA38_11600 [Streptococcus pneumoniae D39]